MDTERFAVNAEEAVIVIDGFPYRIGGGDLSGVFEKLRDAVDGGEEAFIRINTSDDRLCFVRVTGASTYAVHLLDARDADDAASLLDLPEQR